MKSKKCKIALIPSKSKHAAIKVAVKTGKFYPRNVVTLGGEVRYFDLAIVSEEDIKKGDLCIDTQEKTFFKAMYDFTFCSNGTYRKVLATTNPGVIFNEFSVPNVSDAFLNKYCESNGEIKEVQVSYDDMCLPNYLKIPQKCHDMCTNYHNRKSCSCRFVGPVINKGNLVVRKIKDNFTRQEVINILLGYWEDLASHGDGNKTDLLNWIDENV